MKFKSILFCSIFFLFIFSNCKKKDTETLLTTIDISMDSSTVVVNGAIEQLSANKVIDYGICWSTTDNPLADENKISLGSVANKGKLSASIKNIIAGKYFFRTFLIDDTKAYYSPSKMFNVPAFLGLSTSNITVPSAANSAVFQLFSNSSWTSTYNGNWLVPVDNTGQYNAPFNFGFTDNFSAGTRTATIDINCSGSKKTVVINQTGAGAYLQVLPAIQYVPANAGNRNFNVTSNTNWSVACSDLWITLNTTSGINNGPINVIYADNTAPTPRTAAIIVSNGGITPSVTINLTQTALPTIITVPITNITANSAMSGGNVTLNGGAVVTARGVCWSTTTSPTIAQPHTNDGAGVGQFPSTIASLTPNTIYHVRAYATNINGTAYGNELQFTTPNVSSLPSCNCIPQGIIFVHPTDNNMAIAWSVTPMLPTGANSPSDGETNTNNIVFTIGTLTTYAARICYDLDAYGYTDWYLPSIQELNCMYQNRTVLGGFGIGTYWSSSEVTMNAANVLNFGAGTPSQMNKSAVNAVRCIRRDP